MLDTCMNFFFFLFGSKFYENSKNLVCLVRKLIFNSENHDRDRHFTGAGVDLPRSRRSEKVCEKFEFLPKLNIAKVV